MKKPNTFRIFSSIIICAFFLFLAYGSDKQSNENNTSNDTINVSNDSLNANEQTPRGDNACSRCDGLGVVNTYSYEGCNDVSHFSTSDCGSDHHTSECTSSGEKTCPCCHGTGKNQ